MPLFDFEPSGINDTYLRLTRNGLSCILAPAGAWNGLLRVNYVVAGTPGGPEPHMVFRCLDIGWDDGKFCWKGRSAPVICTAAMTDILLERGLVNDGEAERMLFGIVAQPAGSDPDQTLMLRATLAGCTFTPVVDSGGLWGKPTVTGFVLTLMASRERPVLEIKDGLPVLSPEARDLIRKEIGG